MTSVCIQCSQCGLVCVWVFFVCFFFLFCFFHCGCGDPALLPSGGLSVSEAAEEQRSRGCLEKSRHMLHPSLPGFSPSLVFPPFPRVLSHTWTNRSTSRWPRSHSSFLTCVATAHALRALFPPFSPLLPLCLFMLLLLLLPDIFRDELQSTAGGEKNVGGSSFSNVRPASFLLTFTRSFFFFPTGPHPFPSRLRLSFILSIFVRVLLSFTSLSSLLSSSLFLFLRLSNLSLNPPII